ncbi:MAG TPA: TetR/AcrR family transcriptional regulator [Mycobacteriales bacterium]|nr:TetR/AcrR family transcriptional regulator [Mycobacteriales bacterium]
MSPSAPRRERLLDAAAALFASRGYHAVGIDDIGAAAGITGPGVYRHFAGKQALLEHLCDRAMTQLLEGAQGQALAGSLDALVDLHVAFAVDRHTLLGVWVREQRALSDDVRRSLRGRQRAYEQVWREVLRRRRPDLLPDEAQVVVSCTLALLNSTARVDTDMPRERLADLLRTMAHAALSAG